MPPKKQILQFKVTLKEIKPPIWRRIQVPAACTFWDLHVAIQDVMGWLGYHLHEFRVKDLDGRTLSFGIPDDEGFGDDTLPGWKHRVSKHVSLARPRFEYVYDFGDDWRHQVELEEVLPAQPGVTYPRCIKGKRNSPPEDCGGPPGYADLLEVLADPAHPEHEDQKKWVEGMKGGPFAAEKFDPAAVEFSDPKEMFRLAFE